MRWFLALAIPYGLVSKNLQNFFIRIIIFGDIHTFTSLGVFGEYAKSLFAPTIHTPQTPIHLTRMELHVKFYSLGRPSSLVRKYVPF